jgi:hypothetical protein
MGESRLKSSLANSYETLSRENNNNNKNIYVAYMYIYIYIYIYKHIHICNESNLALHLNEYWLN